MLACNLLESGTNTQLTHRLFLPVVDEAVEYGLGAELGGDVGPAAVAAAVQDEGHVRRGRHRLGRQVVVDVLCNGSSINSDWFPLFKRFCRI